MKYYFLFLAFCTCFANNVQAQSVRSASVVNNPVKDIIVKSYEDSLAIYYNRIYNTPASAVSRIDSMQYSPVLLRPYQGFRLFSPLTYYQDIISGRLGPDDKTEMQASTPADTSIISRMLNDAIVNVYLKRPDLVLVSDAKLHAIAPNKSVNPIIIKSDVGVKQNIPQTPIEQEQQAVNVVVVKPNFWNFKGDYYLQFLQNYVSGNWYKGGERNYSMVGSAVLQANYNNKQKVKWENRLELKLGFVTSKSDSLHNLKTSEDLIRYTGKLGLQATKRWYYTIQLVAYTQFLQGYRNNNTQVFSDFMSPFNANLSLGMDYNVSAWKKRLTGSVHLAPLAYNFRYVDRLALATRYGLEADSHTLHDFGSEFTVDLMWKMSEMMSWQTRLYGYTTYRRSEIEWENTITFKFNKYISSKFFIYPRFDDGTGRDAHHGYWQFREFASIGFSYNF